jgi:O-acetyl-ADP-ribose deacetylase (regulator of RNase III)
MAIEFVKGCLLDAFDKGEVTVIGHVVNCQHKMNSGIAKSIRGRYPQVYDFYMETDCQLGLCRSIGWGRKTVCNLYAQDKYGYDGKRYLSYPALAESLSCMSKHVVDSTSLIGFPFKMGADRAGGDWNTVLEMIDFHFKDHKVKIYQLEE